MVVPVTADYHEIVCHTDDIFRVSFQFKGSSPMLLAHLTAMGEWLLNTDKMQGSLLSIKYLDVICLGKISISLTPPHPPLSNYRNRLY